jgi:hypothetical protein
LVKAPLSKSPSFFLPDPSPQQKALQLSVAETKAWFRTKERRGFDFETASIEVEEANEVSAYGGGIGGDVYSRHQLVAFRPEESGSRPRRVCCDRLTLS